MTTFTEAIEAIEKSGWRISVHRGNGYWWVWDDYERRWGKDASFEQTIIQAWEAYSTNTEETQMIALWPAYATKKGLPLDVRIQWQQGAKGYTANFEQNGEWKSWYLGRSFEAALKHLSE